MFYLENHTFLPCPNAPDTDQYPSISNIISPVDEVPECHEPWQWLALLVSQRLFVLHTFVAILMDHEVAAAVSLWEDTREKRSA